MREVTWRGAKGGLVALALLAGACGGTVSDLNGRNGRLSGPGGGPGGASGASGSSGDPGSGSGGAETGGTNEDGGFWHSEPVGWGSGGTVPLGSGGQEFGTGGSVGVGGQSGAAGTGGYWGFSGGAAGYAGYGGGPVDAGPAGAGGSAIYVPISPTCGYSFGSMEWKDSCSPTGGCLNLDPSTWSPVVLSSGSDAGAFGGASVEAPFCQTPVPGRTYTFAFDEAVQDYYYTSFNVATGSAACEGYSIAYLGYPGDGEVPRGSVRTQCFSVDGAFLQSRLAVTYYGAHFSNLRVVSSCPCTRQIPYNTETCPPPNGSAGAPNCM